MTTSIPDIPSLALPRPKRRITRSRAQWQSLVEKFNTSGLTKTAFCKRHGIATSCFYRWHKVLAEENTQDAFVDITEPVATTRSIDRAPNTETTGRYNWGWMPVSYCGCALADVLPEIPGQELALCQAHGYAPIKEHSHLGHEFN